MNGRNVAEKFRSGQYTASDIRNVIDALAMGDNDFLQASVFQYIKRVENINEDALIRYLKSTNHPYVVSQVISGLSYRNCKRADYVEQVLKFAAGTEWDNQDMARLSALLALSRVTECTARVKSILRAAYHSNNPVVRDAALTTAQAYFGTPPIETQWGEGSDDMSKRMPKALLEWLDTDVQ